MLAIYLATGWLLTRIVGDQPDVVALVASALVAVSFLPLRAGLQRRVGRLVYGERDDPSEVMAHLGRLDVAAPPQAVLMGVVKTLARTLRLAYAAIQLDGDSVESASHGRPQGKPISLPLTAGDQQVGRLVLDAGRGREPFGVADRRLLEELTRHVGWVANSILLTNALRRSRDDLQRSREKLVTAREEDRRQISKYLHDTLGGTLHYLARGLRHAERLIARGDASVPELLSTLHATTTSAIDGIREHAYKLRPPALMQLGLPRALIEYAEQLSDSDNDALHCSMRITVNVPTEVPSLPAAVETAAYQIATQALINATQHSGASACRLHLHVSSMLQLEVCDNGKGLPENHRDGYGLTSMRERAAELGGELIVQSASGGGTCVLARLPCQRSENGTLTHPPRR